MIYFIRDGSNGYVKIGYTSVCARVRLAQMQVSTASVLELVGTMEGDLYAEADLHSRYSAQRVRGEWFRPSDDLLVLIAMSPPTPKGKSKTADFWNGYSSQEVSRLTGISKSSICNIRKGKYRPSPAVAIEIQRATGVSAIKLVFGDLADEAA